MTIDLDSLIGGGTTLLAIPMTWWLTNRTTARAEAKGDREALQKQFEQVALAIGELQGVAATNRILWEGWKEWARACTLAGMACLGGWARAEGSDIRRALVGGGDMARILTHERRDRKLAAQRVEPFVTRVATAAAPLLWHADARIADSSERVMAAVRRIEQPQALEAALEDLGNAVRAFLAPSPSRWTRLWRWSRTG